MDSVILRIEMVNKKKIYIYIFDDNMWSKNSLQRGPLQSLDILGSSVCRHL